MRAVKVFGILSRSANITAGCNSNYDRTLHAWMCCDTDESTTFRTRNFRYCMEDDESAWPVLAECPALWQNRIDVFDIPFLQQVPSWTTTQLVQFITMLRESLGSE